MPRPQQQMADQVVTELMSTCEVSSQPDAQPSLMMLLQWTANQVIGLRVIMIYARNVERSRTMQMAFTFIAHVYIIYNFHFTGQSITHDR